MSSDSELGKRPDGHLARALRRRDAHKMGGVKTSEASAMLMQKFLRDADELPDLRVDYPVTVVSGADYFPKSEKLSGEDWVLVKEVQADATKAEIKELQDFQRALIRHDIPAQYLNTEATKHKNATFGSDVGQLSVLVSKADWVKLHDIAGMETVIAIDSPVGTSQDSAGAIKTSEVDTSTTTMTAPQAETPEGARVETVAVTAPANVLSPTVSEPTIVR